MLKEKLTEQFGDRLWMEISAVNDEDIMRDVLDKAAHLIFIDSCVPGTIPVGTDNFATAIEIGTYHGVSAALLAEYFHHVYTFDIIPERGGYYKEKLLAHEIWEYLDITNRIHAAIIDNDKHKQDVIDAIYQTTGNKFDFAFIDGRHIGGVQIDFEILQPYCDLFLFHDYSKEPKDNLRKHVSDFVNSIEGGKIVYVNEPFALWQKDK